MNSTRTLKSVLHLLAAVLLAACAAVATAQTPCAALAGLDLQTSTDIPARIASAQVVQVAAEGLPVSGTIPFDPRAVTRYCQVNGYVAPQNQFVLTLPDAPGWNGKFFFSACAGFCGTVNASSCFPGLAKGYAAVTANGGHYSAPGFDGVWAAGDEGAQRDFAYRGNHAVAVVAKKIIAAYYGSGPRRSYIAGCSKGGQATLMEALRYPDDFDGLVTIAPVYDYTGKSVIHAAWIAQANADGRGGSLLDGAATDLVHKSVLARCDADDGVVDGVVGDPYGCAWKPADLACAPGRTGDCLSPAQVAALQRIYAPPTDSSGRVLFPTGNTLGAEVGEWKAWVNGKGANHTVAQQYLRYLVGAEPAGDAASDPLRFDFDRDPGRLERARSIFDTTSVALDAFFSRGGKILLWHGLADSGIPAASSIHYYLRAMERLGGRAQTERSMRLFLLPGVTHCAGGDGSDRADTLTALDDWVDRGIAPEWLDTSRRVDGVETRLRRIPAYPKLSRYSGRGPVDDPSSWRVSDPWAGAGPSPRAVPVGAYANAYPR